MRNSFNDSKIKVIKIIYKLKQAKIRENNQKLLSNSNVTRKKFNKFKKFI